MAELARPPLHIPLGADDFMEQFMDAWREHVEGFSQMKGRGGAGGSMHASGGGGGGGGGGEGKGGKSKKSRKSKGGNASSLDHLPEWKRRLVLKKQRDAEQQRKGAGGRRQGGLSVDDVRARVQERYRQLKAAKSSGSRSSGTGGGGGGSGGGGKGKKKRKKGRK